EGRANLKRHSSAALQNVVVITRTLRACVLECGGAPALFVLILFDFVGPAVSGSGVPFAAEDSRLYNFVRYDEVTAETPRLADDRHRDFGDPVHFLFCATTGLRCDARRQVCSHL